MVPPLVIHVIGRRDGLVGATGRIILQVRERKDLAIPIVSHFNPAAIGIIDGGWGVGIVRVLIYVFCGLDGAVVIFVNTRRVELVIRVMLHGSRLINTGGGILVLILVKHDPKVVIGKIVVTGIAAHKNHAFLKEAGSQIKGAWILRVVRRCIMGFRVVDIFDPLHGILGGLDYIP